MFRVMDCAGNPPSPQPWLIGGPMDIQDVGFTRITAGIGILIIHGAGLHSITEDGFGLQDSVGAGSRIRLGDPLG